MNYKPVVIVPSLPSPLVSPQLKGRDPGNPGRTTLPRLALPKPCLECGDNTTGATRCSHHHAAKTPNHQGHRDPAYLAARRQVITDHVALFGWTCPGASDLDHAPHPVAEGDLEADHIISLHHGTAQGLTLTDLNHRSNLRPLCQAANRQRGAGR